MKRGEAGTTGLEALVKLLPHLVMTIALLFVVSMFIYYTFFPPLNDAERDFKRLTDDFEDILEAKTAEKLEFSVPVSANEGYTVRAFPGNYPVVPARCKNKSCICLYEVRDGKPYETCKIYADFKNIPTSGECGKNYYWESYSEVLVTKGTPISVSIGKDCNAVWVGEKPEWV